MASSSGGQIGALCAESFCERILSEVYDVCHEGNTLLDTEEINMLVLRMNRGFIPQVERSKFQRNIDVGGHLDTKLDTF